MPETCVAPSATQLFNTLLSNHPQPTPHRSVRSATQSHLSYWVLPRSYWYPRSTEPPPTSSPAGRIATASRGPSSALWRKHPRQQHSRRPSQLPYSPTYPIPVASIDDYLYLVFTIAGIPAGGHLIKPSAAGFGRVCDQPCPCESTSNPTGDRAQRALGTAVGSHKKQYGITRVHVRIKIARSTVAMPTRSRAP